MKALNKPRLYSFPKLAKIQSLVNMLCWQSYGERDALIHRW